MNARVQCSSGVNIIDFFFPLPNYSGGFVVLLTFQWSVVVARWFLGQVGVDATDLGGIDKAEQGPVADACLRKGACFGQVFVHRS